MTCVIQLDAAGRFLGLAEAEESPLEPGVLLLPSGCILTEAPTFNRVTEAARWTGAGWEISDRPAPAALPADPTPEETRAALAHAARARRDALLRGSDWTQLADAPVDHAAWALYRQQLREIPEQAGFPEAIAWPAEP